MNTGAGESKRVDSGLDPVQQFLLIKVIRAVSKKVSGITDVYSSWLMAGFGAAVALVVAREPELGARLPPWKVDLILLFFALSAVAAGLAKRYAVAVATLVETQGATIKTLTQHYDEFSDSRGAGASPPAQVLGEIWLQAAFPIHKYFLRNRIQRAEAEDPTAQSRSCARKLYLQRFWTGFQVLMFLGAVVVTFAPQTWTELKRQPPTSPQVAPQTKPTPAAKPDPAPATR